GEQPDAGRLGGEQPFGGDEPLQVVPLPAQLIEQVDQRVRAEFGSALGRVGLGGGGRFPGLVAQGPGRSESRTAQGSAGTEQGAAAAPGQQRHRLLGVRGGRGGRGGG